MARGRLLRRLLVASTVYLAAQRVLSSPCAFAETGPPSGRISPEAPGVGMFGSLVEVCIFALFAAVITGVVAEIVLQKVIDFCREATWWPRAAPVQKVLMQNFGYPEEACDNEGCLDCYAYVLVMCGHHVICGSMMLPVVIYGWEGVGSMCHSMLLVGAMMDVAIDVYHEFKMACRLFFFEKVKAFWSVPSPKEFFAIMGVLLHPLGMTMVIPLVCYYPQLRAFHLIACALLFAAAICFTSGSYKMTLDVHTKSGFYRFKAIVFVQTVTIAYTRGYVWFTQMYVALSTFHQEGRTCFLIGGAIAGTLMSTFNILMILDAAGASATWLPKGFPQEQALKNELEEDFILRAAPSPSKGTVMASRRLFGLASARKVRVTVKMVVAANKFKSMLKKST